MNPTLDINTPRGRQSFADQQRAVEIVYRNAPGGMAFIHTAGNEAAAIDGFLVNQSVIKGVAEIKSRNMTRQQLFGEFRGEWLLTHAKLQDVAQMSAKLRVSGYGFLYLVPSQIVLVLPLTSFTGGIVCPHRTERTTTQATCNGGTASRLNSYINMNQAITYHA